MLNYNFIENCCKNATSYLQNSKKVVFTMIFSLIISSCSLWSPSDKKEETKDEIIFRVNHGSNAYTIKGTFPQDKQEMLDKIDWMKQHPEIMRPEGLRGF